jgi:uncharacterized protein (TIGR00730 family)
LSSLCVFLGASRNTPQYNDDVILLAETIIKHGFNLIYGGARIGLMGVLADKVRELNGHVTGIMPEYLSHKENIHPDLDNLITVETIQERKIQMATHADAFLVFPGGLGTMEEAFEIWNAIKMGLYQKPIGFLNIDGFFDSLFEFVTTARDSGFLTQEHFELATVSSSIEELINILKNKL